MTATIFEEMKEFVGFTKEDGLRIPILEKEMKHFLPRVIDRFYERLLQHESASAVFVGGSVQIERQRQLLMTWLTDVFAGIYDEEYYQKRLRIGSTHLHVGLPQWFMLCGMDIIWQELAAGAHLAKIPGAEEKLRSLHKLLSLDLAIMLSSYKDTLADKVRATERSAVEEQLTRAEHLAEIGQLAASLAHEIKNPLAGISGAIEVIRDTMASDNAHRPILSEVLGQIKRLDATVRDLLQYARPPVPQRELVPLHQLVTRVLGLLREEPALQHVKVEYEEPRSDVSTFADDRQIEQLLFNLIINAAHASFDGGIIRVSVERDSHVVRVCVQDFGRGMTPEIRDQAFEPFFTTKAKGTGLGLSICRKITDAHGGRIHLDSALGHGTTVTIELPPPTVNMRSKKGYESSSSNRRG
ncbi:MAG: ATP-binding protein [Planctomycetota bacterium]